MELLLFHVTMPLHVFSVLNVFKSHVQDGNCGLSAILSNGPWKEL